MICWYKEKTRRRVVLSKCKTCEYSKKHDGLLYCRRILLIDYKLFCSIPDREIFDL